jgi:hypothetical protein
VRSTWFSSAIFILAYFVCTGAAMWINNPVLCLGDPTYDDGCGGFVLYLPLWALLYSPLVALALVIARPGELRAERYARGSLLLIYLILIVTALEVSFVLDIGLFVLLVEWAAISILFVLLRSLVLSESRRPI